MAEKKKVRGKPFSKGDPRINREGVSKRDAEAKALARQVAQAVLAEEIDPPGKLPGSELVRKKTRLRVIFETDAELAQGGSTEHQKILLEWAYGRPPQEVEVTGKNGGPILTFDIPSAVAERAMEQEKNK
jgi:hypothetical protein